jgi:hypothetical protein
MDGSGGKVRRTEGEWRGIIEAAERSEMTRSGYCRAQGIDYEQFLYHRRKLLTKSAGALATLRSQGDVVASGVARRAFIPVEVGRCRGVRLHFPCGLTLASDELPPAGWLVEVAARWAGAGAAPC